MRHLILASALLFAGCTTSKVINGTEVDCVGLGAEQDPRYVYSVSAWNVFIGIVCVEILFPPIYVLASAWSCPTRLRRTSETQSVGRDL